MTQRRKQVSEWRDDDPCRYGHRAGWFYSTINRRLADGTQKAYPHRRCKECQLSFVRDKWVRRSYSLRAFTKELYYFTRCTDCDREFPYHIIEWDHLPGFEKCGHFRGLPQAEAFWEMNKCQPVCANCHRTRTHERRAAPSAHDGSTAVDLVAWVQALDAAA